jgi:hypothetical protein
MAWYATSAPPEVATAKQLEDVFPFASRVGAVAGGERQPLTALESDENAEIAQSRDCAIDRDLAGRGGAEHLRDVVITSAGNAVFRSRSWARLWARGAMLPR